VVHEPDDLDSSHSEDNEHDGMENEAGGYWLEEDLPDDDDEAIIVNNPIIKRSIRSNIGNC
jgi:hypothetical protein